MTDTLWWILAITMQVLGTLVVYQYLVCRKHKENMTLRKIRFDGPILLLSSAMLCVSVAVFVYCKYLGEDVFLRALFNSMVLIWLWGMGTVDIKEKIIPNVMILVGIGIWVAVAAVDIVLGHVSIAGILLFSVIGMGILGGGLLIISAVTKSSIGMGDIKLFAVLGLLYGVTDAFSILLFSLVIMALFSLMLLVLKKVTTKSKIPMAPFVVIGFIISILAGL